MTCGGLSEEEQATETLLRAMLRAYQTAALDAHLRFGVARCADPGELLQVTEESRLSWEDLQNCCEDIERELVFLVAYHQPVEFGKKTATSGLRCSRASRAAD